MSTKPPRTTRAAFKMWLVMKNKAVCTQHPMMSTRMVWRVLKKYISKWNPKCPAFFQYPRLNVKESDDVWYEDRPLGINKVGVMMKEISKECNLSTIYTNHSVRATAMTLYKEKMELCSYAMDLGRRWRQSEVKVKVNSLSMSYLRTCCSGGSCPHQNLWRTNEKICGFCIRTAFETVKWNEFLWKD